MSNRHDRSEINSLVKDGDHRVLSIWAAECAERVLPIFEAMSDNKSPRAAIAALREFVATGCFSMKIIRKVSLAAHAAARSVPEGPARFAARAAGQAVATAHVPRHSRAAAFYAVKAILEEDGKAAAEREEEWQHCRLIELTNECDNDEKIRLFRR